MKKVAVITGANRGIGWGTTQGLAEAGYEVVLLGRKERDLEARVKELAARDFPASFVRLDLADSASIEAAAAEIGRRFPGGVHVLVNNAGVYLENGKGYDPATVRATLETNTLGPLQFAEALGGVLKKTKGVVVNISSGMGQLSEMEGSAPGYRISKTALNAVTRVLAAEWKAHGVRVNSICPGWVKTDMGGEGAERSVDQAVKGVVWAATLPPDGPTGGFFRDGKAIAW